jgi:hypothetical protein
MGEDRWPTAALNSKYMGQDGGVGGIWEKYVEARPDIYRKRLKGEVAPVFN